MDWALTADWAAVTAGGRVVWAASGSERAKRDVAIRARGIRSPGVRKVYLRRTSELCRSTHSEACLELFAIASAEAKSRLVFQLDLVVAVRAESQAADAIEVDNCGPVNAAKAGWVQI